MRDGGSASRRVLRKGVCPGIISLSLLVLLRKPPW